MTPADGFFNALYGGTRVFGIFVSNICSTKQSPLDRRFKKNSQGILLRPSSPARTYPSTYTAIADNSVVGVRENEIRKSENKLFIEETFLHGRRGNLDRGGNTPQDEEEGKEKEEEVEAAIAAKSPKCSMHGRQNSDTLTFGTESESAERCVRGEISETPTVSENEDLPEEMLKDLDAEDSIPAHVPDPSLKEETNLEEEISLEQ